MLTDPENVQENPVSVVKVLGSGASCYLNFRIGNGAWFIANRNPDDLPCIETKSRLMINSEKGQRYAY